MTASMSLSSDGRASGRGSRVRAAVSLPASREGDPEVQDPAVTAPLLAITNAMVGLYKQAFGRGPTKTRARFAGPDTMVVLLQDGMTVAERNLVALGERTRVREHRLLMQEAFDDEIRSLVERTLNRRVTTVINGMDPERDLTAATFVLEPVPSPSPASVAGTG